jgi:endonuclease/exonuclease/phosphatase family metal-dependent hydrolase
VDASFESDNSVEATDGASPITVATLALRQSGGIGDLFVDDLVVGATFAAVATNAPPPTEPPVAVVGLSVLTYNVKGNGLEDWSTNSPPVQAVGRQVTYLDPDILTFQEIPFSNTWQVAEFVTAYRLGYHLATNSGSDGYIRSVILSRYPITRSQSWLDGTSLVPFGFNGWFTRDLFEAEIAVPGFPQPVHVFTTHLKAGTSDENDAARRAAEASAISNHLVTVFLPAHAGRPYVLTGDLNEDVTDPAVGSRQPVERLTSPPTGLKLTTPVNPFTLSDHTWSIQGFLGKRYDYILPGGLLFSNLVSSQVFRSDRLTSPPPPLLGTDSVTASDHLPVLMVFANPYPVPFRITSVTMGSGVATLRWEAVPGRRYSVESSANLETWTMLTSNLLATGTNEGFSAPTGDSAAFFRVGRVP